MKKVLALILTLAMMLSLAACGAQQSSGGLWDGASYTEDTELGEGAKTLSVEVTAEDKTITFTIHTDAENLRGALEENGLVSGDESEYGLYVKSVNGIAADYDADEVRDAFDLAYDYDLGEWVGSDLIDRWTGDRIDEVAA